MFQDNPVMELKSC